mmetsp:Transcript_59188/g.137842  ORF Transcript_59188/g.137842 Transcript_59188/m.137842 type:complete len:103 (-) Transcript_59188:817-1125(-)
MFLGTYTPCGEPTSRSDRQEVREKAKSTHQPTRSTEEMELGFRNGISERRDVFQKEHAGSYHQAAAVASGLWAQGFGVLCINLEHWVLLSTACLNALSIGDR